MVPPEHYEGRRRKLIGWLAFRDDVWGKLEAESLAHADHGGTSGFAEPRRRVYTCGTCGGKGCSRCREQGGRVEVWERDPYMKGDHQPDPPPRENGGRLQLSSDERARVHALAQLVSGKVIDLETVTLPDPEDGHEDRHQRLFRLHEETRRRHPFLARLERALALGLTVEDLVRLDGAIPRPPGPYRFCRENPRSKGADVGKPDRI